MALFRKRPPAACPKCGKADGWHVLMNEISKDYVDLSSAVNSFSAVPIRSSYGRNLTDTLGKKSGRLRYHCDSCGYEKTY